MFLSIRQYLNHSFVERKIDFDQVRKWIRSSFLFVDPVPRFPQVRSVFLMVSIEPIFSICLYCDFDPDFSSSLVRFFVRFDPIVFSWSVCIINSIQTVDPIFTNLDQVKFVRSSRSWFCSFWSKFFVRSDPNFLFVSIRRFLFDPCLVILTKLKVTQE